MAYFITDEDSTKGRDPNINIINSIHKIKGKTSVNILVIIQTNTSNSTKENTPNITDNLTSDQPDTHSTNSITPQKMMAEQVQLDTFNPPHHTLRPSIKSKLNALLQEYTSQFAKDEITIGTTPITEMTIDTGTSDPVSQKPYLIAMTNYQWVKEEIEKLLTAKVICSSRSSWSVPVIVVPKGDEGK